MPSILFCGCFERPVVRVPQRGVPHRHNDVNSRLVIGNENIHLSIDNESRTCERCSPINFANLERTKPGPYVTLFTIDDLSQSLADRHCPICQILQTAIEVHRAQYRSAKICWERAFPGRGSMGTIRFRYSMGESYEALHPHLTVHDDTALPRRLKTQHASRRVDFERAKTWIDACKDSHLGCATRFSSTLKNLRVIDCVTRKVLSAPENCVYVALSYVWGTSGICGIQSSSALRNEMPRTVKDSIAATLMLGYRYLWVDKYVRSLLAICCRSWLTWCLVHRPSERCRQA